MAERDGADPDIVPVLIVGAGPTGVTAALLLAGLGVASMVVDRQENPHPLPRAVHLDDEAARILQHVGIDAEFAAISRPAAGLRLLDARLRPFAEFRRDRAVGEHGHPEANLFDQPDLERLLRAQLARRPQVRLLGGTELVEVGQSERTAVHVTLRDTRTGRLTRISARAVLGCDGAGSATRAAIGARLRDLRFEERWFVLDARCSQPLPTWGGVDQVCDPRRAATFMALPGDRYRWEFRMRSGETAEELARPDRVAALTAPWRVPGSELEVLRAAEYTFRARIADRWRAGRVLLAGDAAHLTPPFIGQGLGAGLRDVHNLAWKLAAVLDGAADEDTLLDSYQAERAPHTEAVIRAAVLVGRAMTGGQSVAAALRRPLTGVLLRVPGVRARALRGIATRFPPGPLVDRRRHRRDLPGTMCPQPTVGVDGHAVRLDDVLGDGYALVAAGAVPPDLHARAQRLGARIVRIGPAVDPTESTIHGGDALRAWLDGGRASAALLRPDRIVLATAPMTIDTEARPPTGVRRGRARRGTARQR